MAASPQHSQLGRGCTLQACTYSHSHLLYSYIYVCIALQCRYFVLYQEQSDSYLHQMYGRRIRVK